jgi:hypothetical protein
MANLDKINLLIDSAQRMNMSESSTDFNVSLINSIKVKNIKLKHICIPSVIYNITSSNNTIDFVINTTPLISILSLTMTPGKYTITSLLSALNTLLATNIAPYGNMQVSYNTNTGYFTITFEPIPPLINQFALSGSLPTALGFEFINYNPMIVNGSSTSTIFSPLFINSSEYFKLSLTYLDGSILYINNSQVSTTFIIENNLNNEDDYMGKKICITNINDDTGKNNHYEEAVNMQNFKVTLRNQNNEIVNLNNSNWYCVLEVLTEQSKTFAQIQQQVQLNTNKITSKHLPLWFY